MAISSTKKLSQLALEQGVKWFHVSGQERFTTASLPPSGPSANTNNHAWPLPKQQRGVFAVPRMVFSAGQPINIAPSFGGARMIGYRRSSGRTHAGVDLFAAHNDPIHAVADGTILSFYWYYRSTFALFIDHGDFIVNYGEVRRDSLKRAGLTTPIFQDGNMKTVTSSKLKIDDKGASQFEDIGLSSKGSPVSKGQLIAYVGKMYRSSMLHFEMYSSPSGPATVKGIAGFSKRWTGFPSGAPPSGLLDPTNFLLTLAGKKAEDRVPQREEKRPISHCR
jgi:murein DD-endopeptidase MepM/ murein hydrolase activator NlpD